MKELSTDRKDRILISVYSSSIGIAIITLTIVAALEVLMLGVSVVMAGQYGQYLWKYRAFYVVLLVAALAGIAIIRYVRVDMEHRFRILKTANPIFACFLLGWALFVTYSDASVTGVVSPILFLTFSLVVPISFFVVPFLFAVITIRMDDRDISIGELAKTADKNMYDSKNRYYKEKGIDRRKF